MRSRKRALVRYRYVGIVLGLLLFLTGVAGRLNAKVSDAFSIQAAATQLQWTSTNVQPSPIGRVEGMAAVVDGKLYTFGGFIDQSYNATKRGDAYDPATNTWERLPPMPKGLTHVGTTAYGRNIYLAGGYEAITPGASKYGGQIFAINDVYKYNVDTRVWTALPPLPAPRGSGELSVVNGIMHFFSGVDINRLDRGEHWVMPLTGVNAEKGWTAAASMPNPSSHLGDAVLNGKLYAIGGQHDTDEKLVAQTSVYRYDPATDKWTQVASLPRRRSHISSATTVLNGRIYVFGGEYAHLREIRDVTEYNPATNRWTNVTSLPVARRSTIARRVNDQIICTTGGPNFQTTTYVGRPVISN